MKKILLSILFIGLYAQAESMPQAESIPQTESMLKVESEKTGFFSISLGGEVIPLDNFTVDAIVTNITFGGKISEQSFFEVGVKLVDNGGLLFRYGYSFMKGRHWIPGVDITLLASIGYNGAFEKPWRLSGGLELGPYLKTFISNSYALFVRLGMAHYAVIGENIDIEKFRTYLNLGIQWHF